MQSLPSCLRLTYMLAQHRRSPLGRRAEVLLMLLSSLQTLHTKPYFWRNGSAMMNRMLSVRSMPCNRPEGLITVQIS